MVDTTLDAHGVSPPPLGLPKNTITPEQVLHHHRSCAQGRLWGDRHFPLLHRISTLYSISQVKGILQSPFYYLFVDSEDLPGKNLPGELVCIVQDCLMVPFPAERCEDSVCQFLNIARFAQEAIGI